MYKSYPVPFKWTEQYVILNRANLIATVSDDVTNVIRQKGYAGAAFAFPLGVDTDIFRPNSSVRQEVRKLLGLETEFLIGFGRNVCGVERHIFSS